MTADSAAAAPFSPRAALALVIGGIVLFVVILWLIGSGMSGGRVNNGGAHGGSKGLTGYAAFSDYLDRRGFAVSAARSNGGLTRPGALILTPLASADPKDLERIVRRHRTLGPTFVVVPKWIAMPPQQRRPDAKQGWVTIMGADQPNWPGFYDNVMLSLDRPRGKPAAPAWTGAGLSGSLPSGSAVASGRGSGLIPLVRTQDGRALAAYVADGGDYPGLRAMALEDEPPVDADASHGDYPVIFVFEPDLIDNYGLSRPENAALGERLITAALEGEARAVAFDVTLNGLGRQRNLLTLAFEPPFLAATLCLLLAALVLGWRAFNRFGPVLVRGRALAFGKAGLVAGAAGLVRRTRRLHLIGGPYADAALARLSRALALPARLPPAEAEVAIDRALAARAADQPPFSATAAALRAARRPTDLLRAARTLHRLERTLTT